MLTSVFVIVGVAVLAVVAMFGMGWWLDRYHSHDVEQSETSEVPASSRPEETGGR